MHSSSHTTKPATSTIQALAFTLMKASHFINLYGPALLYTLQILTRNRFKKEQLISHRIKHASSHISGHKSAVAVSSSSVLQTAESVPFPQRKYY